MNCHRFKLILQRCKTLWNLKLHTGVPFSTCPRYYNINPTTLQTPGGFTRGFENQFAYEVMQSNDAYRKSLFCAESHEFEKSAFQDQISQSKQSSYQSEDNLNQLCETIKASVKTLSDDDLIAVLSAASMWPLDFRSGDAFKQMWKHLDEDCLLRLPNWSMDEALLVGTLWYNLYLSKKSDFLWIFLRKSLKKIKHLTKSQVVQTMFLVNTCRKFPDGMPLFEIEFYLVNTINMMSLDEMAIVTLAFFKTQSKIKNQKILSVIIDKLIAEVSTCNSFTLGMIAKTIRYSLLPEQADRLAVLLEKLKMEVPRLELVTLTHVALTGTNILLMNKDLLRIIIDRFQEQLDIARLKDIERLLLVMCLFNLKDQSFVDIVLSHMDSLEKDIDEFPLAFISLVNYFTVMDIYPQHLINKALSKEFVNTVLEKKKLGRELVHIDVSVEIECPGYAGNRLDPRLRRNISRNANFKPNLRGSTAMQNMSYELEDVLISLYGKEHLHWGTVMPHFVNQDFVLGFDAEGKSRPIPEDWRTIVWGNVRRPPDTTATWLCIIVGGWNTVIRNTGVPLGTTVAKMRHMSLLGYHPVVVPWYQWKFSAQQQRVEFVKEAISSKLKAASHRQPE